MYNWKGVTLPYDPACLSLVGRSVVGRSVIISKKGGKLYFHAPIEAVVYISIHSINKYLSMQEFPGSEHERFLKGLEINKNFQIQVVIVQL